VSAGLDNLKHVVVLMMENRSFDHMLGALHAADARINGLAGNETNPDTANEPAQVAPQGRVPEPARFPTPTIPSGGAEATVFRHSGPPAVAAMQGFVQSYWDQQHNVAHSHKIMYYFAPASFPCLHTLAQSYAVFNGWFSSIPGPTVCNRAFAHYGTSFGQVNLDIFYVKDASESIYERMLAAGRTTKLYYFDPSSSTQEVVNLLKNQPQIFGTYQQFLEDCKNNALPDYSFVEPNYSDHPETTAEIAGVGPASGSRRASGRSLHRVDLRRHPPKSGSLAKHRAADHLR